MEERRASSSFRMASDVIKAHELEINSLRKDLKIPEYGRNIQKMVEFAMTLEDREQRNQCCKAILSVMGQLFPYLRDMEDFNHKLWVHLMIISNFQLDVDCPYPMPKQEELKEKPNRVAYPSGDVKFGHYGRYVEKMIDKCAVLDEGEEKKNFTQSIANLMKQNALNWNRNTVTDDVVLKDLQYLSKGKISVENIQELTAVKTIQGNKLNDFLEDGFRKKNKKNKKRKFIKR
jgi:Domain of unknown function (DUF4290)